MITAFKNSTMASEEFEVLSKIANRMKPCIMKCQNLNIYSDIQAFESTAVLIRNDANKDMSRAEALKNIDENSYINACHIKSPLKESLGDEPSGFMIAT